MIFLEILVEGTSDVPAVKEILRRAFNLIEDKHFRIHPHKCKGSLPQNPLAKPDPRKRGLLDQLPAKLRGFSHLSDEYCVIVLVDSDKEDCKILKQSLVNLYNSLDVDKRPVKVLFRIAVEELESWFIADRNAIRLAYPRTNLKWKKLPDVEPDNVIGAWERLAEILGRNPRNCGVVTSMNGRHLLRRTLT